MSFLATTTYNSFASLGPQALASLRGPLPTWGLSTESPWQQWGLCEAIVRQASGNQALMAAGTGLLYWHWQERPLNLPAVSLLAALDKAGPFLDPQSRQLAALLKKNLTAPLAKQAWQDVQAQENPTARVDFLGKALSGPLALAWLSETWEDLVCLEDQPLARALLAGAVPEGPLGVRLAAELAYHHADLHTAARLAASLAGTPFAPFGAYLWAECADLTGGHEQAALALAGLWRAMPWHVNLALKLHDLAALPRRAPLRPGRAAVLVYTWNKAELARQTLESVLTSDIGDSPVFVLDNGSTDQTGAMLAGLADTLPKGRLTVVSLPVNIGAPGARNWLLSLPEVRAQTHAAFLDDDVILPADWLARLTAAAARHPKAATIGCTIRDHLAPHRLQSADYHLLHQLPGPEGQAPGERVRVFNNCTGALDIGMFRYERPCLSVSGCCHLLDLAALDEVGGFDIRFTPTQFDDLDRDMRAFQKGRPCVYTGHLAVDHVQRSSLRQASSPAQVAHIMGNKIKLEAAYPDETLAPMIQANFGLAWQDLLHKTRALAELYPA